MKKNDQGALEKLLQEITPQEQAKTDAKMQLAAKIADAMAAKGWNNKVLMEMVGKKSPSEITRWLSGTHNFTVDTLIDLGRALGTDFLSLTHRDIPVQQFNISVVSYSRRQWINTAVVNEPLETYSYSNQAIYS